MQHTPTKPFHFKYTAQLEEQHDASPNKFNSALFFNSSNSNNNLSTSSSVKHNHLRQSSNNNSGIRPSPNALRDSQYQPSHTHQTYLQIASNKKQIREKSSNADGNNTTPHKLYTSQSLRNFDSHHMRAVTETTPNKQRNTFKVKSNHHLDQQYYLPSDLEETDATRKHNRDSSQEKQYQSDYRRYQFSPSPIKQSTTMSHSLADNPKQAVASEIKQWIASHENRYQSLLNSQNVPVNSLLESCTFHPNLELTKGYVSTKEKQPGNIVERLYKDSKYKRYEYLHEQNECERQEKELEQCTFKPEINDTWNKENANNSPDRDVKGFESAVERMRLGFSKSQKTLETLNKIRRGSFFERNKMRKFNPPSMLLRNAGVFFSAKITLSNGITKKKIEMKEDDDPLELAKSFAETNNLSSQEHELLKKTLVKEFKAHLLVLIQQASEQQQQQQLYESSSSSSNIKGWK